MTKATSSTGFYVKKEVYNESLRLSKIKDKMILEMVECLAHQIDCDVCPCTSYCETMDDVDCTSVLLHNFEKQAKEEQDIEDKRYEVL